MILIVLLLLIGVACIYFEFFLPGGILGFFGAILCISSTILFIRDVKPLILLLPFLILEIALIYLVIKKALKRIRSNKHQGLYLDDDQEGYKGSCFDVSIVGQQGSADTALRPSGFIRIGNKRFQAVSEVGFIAKGEKIEVSSGEGSRLIVHKIHQI